MISLSCAAQDLIARQAPSDKHLKDVRNVKINGRISSSTPGNLQNPASNIYSDWKNTGVSVAHGHVPSNYKIDLTGFHMPTPSRKVTSNFGQRWGRLHAGLDIKVYIGDTIRAAFDGKVRISQYAASGYGYYIVIRHPNGLETLYGHLSKLIAKENQIVRAGDVIGLGGNTGRSTGSHLHFETRICGTPINPALMFDFPNQDIVSNTFVYRGASINNNASVASRNAKKVEADNEKREKEVASTAAPLPEVKSTETTSKEATPADSKNINSGKSKKDRKEKESSKDKDKKDKKSSKSDKKKKKDTAYSVKDGDNLYQIAQKHGTTVAKICKDNGIKESAPIHKGQKLKLS